jgi:hypothetical protein
MKSNILSFIIVFFALVQISSAQQHFFYGLQADYGVFGRNYDQNRTILKGQGVGRMINLRLSVSYRIFDALSVELGTSLNGYKLRMNDIDFKKRNPGFESLVASQARYLSFYSNLKYSHDIGRKRYYFFRPGVEYSAIGSKQLTKSTQFQTGNERISMITTFGKSNWALTPEIGYEYFNSSGNLISIGLKYHYKFSGNNLVRGDYQLSNQANIYRKDGVNVSGSYVAVTFQINGLLAYQSKKERVKRVKDPVKLDTVKTVPPVLVETKPVDTTKKVQVTDKVAYDREYAVTNKIKVQSNKVTITVWDHQIEDGDRVNLILNDDWILTNYELKAKKHVIVVELKPGTNNLILYALNLGKYKPNTAAISVDDGTKVQQIILESTLDESSALEIKVEK